LEVLILQIKKTSDCLFISSFYDSSYEYKRQLNIRRIQQLQNKKQKCFLTKYKRETLQSKKRLKLANKLMAYPISPYFLDNQHTFLSKYHFNPINIFVSIEPSGYLRFFKYLLPIVYPIIEIAINKINAIFIGELILLPEINTLKSNIRNHIEKKKVKITAINCSEVLTIAGTISNISQEKNHLFCFNIFVDFIHKKPNLIIVQNKE
jgi:hypothetical protein